MEKTAGLSWTKERGWYTREDLQWNYLLEMWLDVWISLDMHTVISLDIYIQGPAHYFFWNTFITLKWMKWIACVLFGSMSVCLFSYIVFWLIVSCWVWSIIGNSLKRFSVVRRFWSETVGGTQDFTGLGTYLCWPVRKASRHLFGLFTVQYQ